MHPKVESPPAIPAAIPAAGQPLWRRITSALRIHQWSKNLLIFVPVVTSHRIGNRDSVLAAGLAFVAFCLCASAVYIVNDVLDIEVDRRHPVKRLRPFAAGVLPVKAGYFLVPLLLLAAAICARWLHPAASAVLVLYLLLALAYSLYIKRKLLLDVYEPDGFTGRRPGVVLIHGGGWYSGDKGSYKEIGNALAEKGFVAFSIYLPTLLKDEFHLTPADAGFRTAGFVVLATLLRPAGGLLSDRIRRIDDQIHY